MPRPVARAPRLKLAALLALGQVLGRGSLALALLVAVRYMPTNEFGDLALVLAIVGIAITIADAGFSRLIVRDVAREGGGQAALVAELLEARLAWVVAVTVALGLLLLVIPGPFSVAVAGLAAAYLMAEAIAFGFENAAIGAERPWRFVAAQAGFAGVLLVGLVALVMSGDVDLVTVLGALLTASAIKVVGHLAAWRRADAERARAGAMSRWSALYRAALPFLGLTLLATVYYRVGIIVLYAIRGADETAAYGAALRFVDAAAIVAGIAFSAVSPTLSRTHRDRPDEVWRHWKERITITAAVMTPLVVAGVFAANDIARLLFGAKYEQSAGDALRLLMPGMGLMVLQAFSAAVVFMADGHRDVLRLTVFNVMACVVMSIVLSAEHGANGAAAALSLAELLSFASFAALIRRRHAQTTARVAPPSPQA